MKSTPTETEAAEAAAAGARGESGGGVEATPPASAPAVSAAATTEGEAKPPSAPEAPEEVDVWWGALSLRTVLPGVLVCVLATVLLLWLTWQFVPAQLFKLSFMGLAGVLWVVQLSRWGYRFFGFNYRMTTRRLFCHRGFHNTRTEEVELACVAAVVVRCNWRERKLGVGQVIVCSEDSSQPPLILEGLRDPSRVAEDIRVRVKQAREQREQAGKP